MFQANKRHSYAFARKIEFTEEKIIRLNNIRQLIQ